MKKNLYFGFLRNYLCFAMVVMFLLVPIYLEAFYMLEKESEDNIYESMEHGLDLLSEEVQSIHNIMIRFPNNQHYAYVRSLEKPEQSSDYYALYSVKNYLSDITSSLMFPTQVMVWFSNEIVMTPETVYSRPEQKSYRLFEDFDDQNVKEWFQNIAKEELRYQFIEAGKFRDRSNQSYDGLPMVHTYTTVGKQETVVFVCIFDMDTIYELMGFNQIGENAHIIIKDPRTEEILYENQPETGKEACVRFEAEQLSLPLAFEVEIPKRYFTAQLKGMWMIAFVYLLLFVLIALIMAVFLAKKTAVPMNHIVTTLKRYREESDQQEFKSYEDIESTIERMGDKGLAIMNAHDKLNAEVNRWLLREWIVNGLEGKDVERAQELERILSMPIRLLIIQVTGEEQCAEETEMIGLLKSMELYPLFFCRSKNNLFAVLVKEEALEILREKLNRMLESARDIYSDGMIVFASAAQKGLAGIHERYLAGRYSMKYLSVQKLILQEELETAAEGGLSELNLVENVKLTDLILNGNKEEAGNIVSRQWYQVSTAREYALIEQLYYMQAAVLNSAAAKLGSERRTKPLGENDVIVGIENSMLEFTEYLCNISLQKKQDKKNVLAQSIVEYIDNHYTDPDFYMGTLAEVFHLSDRTISKLIKGYCNCGFSEYLEGMRIQKARTLLENPKLSVEAIAKQSGFGLENTFYKVFKRVYNVSPSAYRANLNYLKQKN